MVGNIKTTTFKDNRGGVEDTPGCLFTYRAFGLRLVMKALPQLKTLAAFTALIFINRHDTPYLSRTDHYIIFYIIVAFPDKIIVRTGRLVAGADFLIVDEGRLCYTRWVRPHRLVA